MSEAKKSGWEVWMERLPKATVDAIAGRDTQAGPVTDFAAFVNTLPPQTQKAVALVTDGPPPPPEETCKEAAKRFGCVESNNGDFATVRLFPDAESLVRYLGSVEGHDKVMWCFHGVPLRFTVGPQRYLFMPDGATAMSVPLTPGLKILRVEADLITADIQEDGFVGPAYLASTDGLHTDAPPEATPAAKPNSALDDEELYPDDDEDK